MNLLKSTWYTLLICIVSIYGIYNLIHLIFGYSSKEQYSIWLIVSFCISIIFTISYFSFTILEELKKEK